MRDLSRGELAHLLNLATACLHAATREELAAIISGLNEVIPYKKAVLCMISPPGCATSIGDFLNHSYGPQWADVYTSEKFERVDPVLRQCIRSNGAFEWRDVVESAVNPASASFLDAAREFGLVNGTSFVCGHGTAMDPRTVLSIADVEPSKRKPRRVLAALSVFGPHIHEAYKRILRRQEGTENAVKLTPREVEVLNWKQDGKTGWEIGCILGISQRTVKFHLTRIEAKLNVVNASHAIAKALRLGLIQ